MGRTTFKTPYCSLFSSPEDENPMNFGIINQDGTVLGSYLHGFMDNNFFHQSLLCYIKGKLIFNKPSN
jgi:cobyric acid synthase